MKFIRFGAFTILPLILLSVLTVSAHAVYKPENRGYQGVVDVTKAVNQGTSRSCQAKEAGLKTRMTRLMDLVQGMETTFDSIASRVETYYTTKIMPNGKTVTNYSTYKQDIQMQKNNVQSTVTKAQEDATSFSCSTGNPKAQLIQFRKDMQLVKTALKNYRTSIKNLIVAIHPGLGPQTSESPKPTK